MQPDAIECWQLSAAAEAAMVDGVSGWGEARQEGAAQPSGALEVVLAVSSSNYSR